jgi:hypothetical protein
MLAIGLIVDDQEGEAARSLDWDAGQAVLPVGYSTQRSYIASTTQTQRPCLPRCRARRAAKATCPGPRERESSKVTCLTAPPVPCPYRTGLVARRVLNQPELDEANGGRILQFRALSSAAARRYLTGSFVRMVSRALPGRQSSRTCHVRRPQAGWRRNRGKCPEPELHRGSSWPLDG